MDEMRQIEVIVGTYEEILVGYRLKKKDSTYSLEQSFTNHSHNGSIRCLASRDQYLASGSSDESIKLFNLKTRAEIGSILEHEGTVNCLCFYDSRHMFSGSEDGKICIWRTRDWSCLKTLLGHKAGVTSLSVHQSGKLAMSVSKDKSMKTWNLLKGRNAYTTNIYAVADIVRWSPKGTLYAVVIGSTVNIYKLETAAIVHKIDYGRRINAIEFLAETILAIGGDSDCIEFHAAHKKAILCVLQTGTKRTKALDCIISLDNQDERWLIASSSDGYIKIWKFTIGNLSKREPELVAQVSIGCRITCQTVFGIDLSVENGDDNEKVEEVQEAEETQEDISEDDVDTDSDKEKNSEAESNNKRKSIKETDMNKNKKARKQ